MLTTFGKFIYTPIYCGWDGTRNNSSNVYTFDPSATSLKDIQGNNIIGELGGYYNPFSSRINAGIVFGTNESVSADMYTLQNRTGIYPTNTTSIHFTKNGDVLTQAFVVSNNTSSDITYTCFGRATDVINTYNNNYSYQVLTAVFMLDAPVTIPANSSKTIEIKFDLSNL